MEKRDFPEFDATSFDSLPMPEFSFEDEIAFPDLSSNLDLPIEDKGGAMLGQEERQGLTMWGKVISAQSRGDALAIHILPTAPTDADGAVLLPKADVLKLRDLINAAEEGGIL